MLRILYSVAVGSLILSAMPAGAQQPGGAATAPRSTAVTPARIAPPKILPGTRPGAFSTIQGNALDSTNGSLSNANVRLRDARFGQIVEAQMTDRAGAFSFQAVDPGSYIVEVVGRDRVSVLAASEVINVGPGDAVSAIVKLPINVPRLAAILGGTATSAAVVTTQAAAAGVLAAQVSGAPTCVAPQ